MRQRYKLWKKYFCLSNGLITFSILKKNNISDFLDNLQIFKIGFSWGGFESLALYQDKREQGNREYLKLAKDEHLVRLHIGLEDSKDLIDDLKKSLRHIK